MLVSQGQANLSFFHRSLQEYLAAVHLARTPSSNQQAVIRERLADPRWERGDRRHGLPVPQGRRRWRFGGCNRENRCRCNRWLGKGRTFFPRLPSGRVI